MSEPISQAKSCTLKPAKKFPLPVQQGRFTLSDSHFDTEGGSYVRTADVRHADRHDYLMETNAAYRTFHYISVIFGAHDERTPEQYRGGLKRIVER